ncbi:uncharacterized protein QYS62_009367 [Fusarium acuminatum]|uniref:Uncharacterized protein n=1 Tax=Fusarium acuminatum TaxID=5515 RepID=A0ABZ2X527_9HYPO
MSSHSNILKALQDTASTSRRGRQESFTAEDGASVRSSSFVSKDMVTISLSPDSDSDSDSDKDVEGWEALSRAEIGAAVRSESSVEQPDPHCIVFDDRGMVDVHHPESDEDTDSEDDAEVVRRDIPDSWFVPMPPFFRDSTPTPVHEPAGFVRNLPGVRAVQEAVSATVYIAQNSIYRSYSSVVGGVRATTQSTYDAVATVGQVGEYIAGGALTAGQNVAVMVQESWPILPRPFNRGIMDTVTGYLLEGMQSLPPSDAIIRPQGRRMH